MSEGARRLRVVINPPASNPPVRVTNENVMRVTRPREFAGDADEVEFQFTWGKVGAKVWGPEGGRPVIALHGWLDNAGSFDKLIPLLPNDLRVVVVETPGHGLSDAFYPDIAYNFLDGLIAVEKITKLLKWDRFSFLAHSLGGCLSMLYAGVFPEKVEKMVSLDVIRLIPTRADTMDVRLRKTIGKLLKYEEAIVAGPERPISYEEAMAKSIAGTLGSLDEEACRILFKRGLKEVDGGYVFRRDRRFLAAPLSFTPKEEMLHLARKVTAEVLIVKYSSGPYFEPVDDYMEHVDALRVSSKRVEYVEAEGLHHAHLTHPDRVAPIISTFFNS